MADITKQKVVGRREKRLYYYNKLISNLMFPKIAPPKLSII